MSRTIVADIKPSSLVFKPEPSDRFVYSNYYVPLQLTFDDSRTPILPFYKKQALLEATAFDVIPAQRLREILHAGDSDSTWLLNRMDDANRQWVQGQHQLQDRSSRESPDRRRLAARTPSASAEMRMRRDSTSRTLGGRADSSVSTRPTVLSNQDVEFVQGLIRPDVGYAFLDRTRITPIGFALGEHVYALSLAPGEEAVMEQKTYTKRQLTFEEQTEQEKQYDLELASTYTTELQEGLERQRSLTDTSGLSLSHTGQYTSPKGIWGQFNASHTISYTRNVTEADQQVYRRSVKDSQTASSKVAARYRAQHKTTFRLTTEQGFESTSKRTIKNPNATTPVTLHYFKVLQRLEMKQERYGVRLCWAPAVKDPAVIFLGKLKAAHQAVIDDANNSLPMPPVEPPSPPSSDEMATTTRHTTSVSSDVIEADKWGLSGDMSASYDVEITMPEGYTWDGSISDEAIAIFSKRPDNTISRWIVGRPYPAVGSTVNVRVHIGAPSWIGGPGITFQVTVSAYQDVAITDKSSEDSTYASALTGYQTRLKQWEDNRDSVLASAQKQADERVQQLLAQVNPVNEMISQIIEREFPASVRDEMWEIDYWQRLFEWDRAAFVAYPGWWSANSDRDPLLDPSDFLNASWAKLYLPVRIGMEKAALRWIFVKSVEAVDQELETRFEGVVADLEDYRKTVIGAEREMGELSAPCAPAPDLFRCMARWEELMPTDGTHIEVVLSTTSAADAITTKEIADAAAVRAALLQKQGLTSALADKAKSLMTEPAKIEVRLGDPSGLG